MLLSELLLTRIFSVTMFYHLSFMVVSLAMLGFGASGLLVSLAPARFPPERLHAQAATAASLFAVTSVAAVGLSFRLPISLDTTAANWARIGATYLACALPFLFGGLAVSLILAHRAERANRLYFFDLLGAAFGCLVLIPATNALGAPTAILFAGAVAGASGLVLAGRQAPRQRAAALAVAAALVVGVAVNARLHLIRRQVRQGRAATAHAGAALELVLARRRGRDARVAVDARAADLRRLQRAARSRVQDPGGLAPLRRRRRDANQSL